MQSKLIQRNVFWKKLIKLGSNFDVASAGEIRLLSKMGVSGEKMIYANPVKTIEGLIEASKVGIKRFTFDSENEIDKIKKICTRCRSFSSCED